MPVLAVDGEDDIVDVRVGGDRAQTACAPRYGSDPLDRHARRHRWRRDPQRERSSGDVDRVVERALQVARSDDRELHVREAGGPRSRRAPERCGRRHTTTGASGSARRSARSRGPRLPSPNHMDAPPAPGSQVATPPMTPGGHP